MHHIRPRFLTLTFTASLLLWASIVSTPATAAVTPVTFALTGTVDQISSSLLGGTSPFGSDPYVPGSLMLTGRYTFDSSTPNIIDPNVDPTTGFYPNTILGHTVQLRDSSNTVLYDSPLSTTPGNFIQISAGIPELFQQTLVDRYDVVFVAVPGSPVNGIPPTDFQINLSGPQGIFNNVELPTTPPSISSFTKLNQFTLSFFDPNVGGGVVLGTITDITPVPLPPAVILFGAGLVALIGLGAGRWRQTRLSLT